MSHLVERKEKNCLNCNAIVQGRYCHICGQENVEIKESFFHLVTHFVYDVTHFDSKFFFTLKYLLFRPGFLVTEYMKGRRNSYLNPIKMYVFTSAIFFIIFFGTVKFNGIENIDANTIRLQQAEKSISYIDSLIGDTNDSIRKQSLASLKSDYYERIAVLRNKKIIKKNEAFRKRNPALKDTLLTAEDIRAKYEVENAKDSITIFKNRLPSRLKNLQDYRDYQSSLPKEKRDNWIQRKFGEKFYSLKGKGVLNFVDFPKLIMDKFAHSFPQMFFISLPIFALVLQILYGRKKSFFYVNHLIFSVYAYITTFVISIVFFLISKLNESLNYSFLNILSGLIYLASFFHLYKAMRNVYLEKRFKTIVKFIILNAVSFFVIIFLSVIFLVLTFFNV